MLAGHSASFLNAKVKQFVSDEHEIDVYDHAALAYEEIAILMDTFARRNLIDEERARICADLIEVFARLKEPVDMLVLADLKKGDDELASMELGQTHISLDYLCRLLCIYLREQKRLLFSFWGRSIDERLSGYFPGLFNVLDSKSPGRIDAIKVGEKRYSLLRRESSLVQPDDEMICMFRLNGEDKLSRDEVDFFWGIFKSLRRALSLLGATM